MIWLLIPKTNEKREMSCNSIGNRIFRKSSVTWLKPNLSLKKKIKASSRKRNGASMPSSRLIWMNIRPSSTITSKGKWVGVSLSNGFFCPLSILPIPPIPLQKRQKNLLWRNSTHEKFKAVTLASTKRGAFCHPPVSAEQASRKPPEAEADMRSSDKDHIPLRLLCASSPPQRLKRVDWPRPF